MSGNSAGPVVAIQRYRKRDGIVDSYRAANAVLSERGAAHGVLAHLCFQSDDELIILNLWESALAARVAADRPDYRDALKAAGFDYVSPQVLPLVNYVSHTPAS